MNDAPTGALLVPVRNPFDTYLSHTSHAKPIFSESWLVSQFATLIWQCERARRVMYFPLDVSDRDHLLSSVCSYTGGNPKYLSDFEWTPVGVSDLKEPKDTEVPLHMRDRLQFAVEWYRYRTENWIL
ncbi:MAG: hypothetical protein R3268_04975 [Acidiferrobacterales bacterium]|nr:hypothetical protein [Acidiferrobacterales bacterium]